MSVDIIATAEFTNYLDKTIPKRLVFTLVWDADIQLVIEPFKTQSDGQCLPAHDMRAYLLQFYNDHFQDQWIKDTIGCIDPTTFLYLLPLMPRISYLEHLKYNENYDPIVIGKAAAATIKSCLM